MDNLHNKYVVRGLYSLVHNEDTLFIHNILETPIFLSLVNVLASEPNFISLIVPFLINF